MNKVFSVNLGGIPVTLDDDAYHILDNYLKALDNHFKQGDGYEEIIYDIENRIGELLKQGLEGRAIANTQDVKNAISIMGKPEDFGAKPMDEKNAKSNEQNVNADEQKKKGYQYNYNYNYNYDYKTRDNASGFQFKPGKRLMRNPDDKIIGGVCSGLSAYLGISEPIFLRIAFLLLLFFGGSGFLLYIILLIIMPKAVTVADKLAMRGEPVDVNSIAGEVGKNFSSKVTEVAGDLNQSATNPSSGLNNVLSAIVDIFAGGIKFFVIFILVIIAFSIFMSWLGISIGYFALLPYANLLITDNTVITIATVNIFFLVTIPLLAIILFLRRILFKKSGSIGLNITLVGLFLINLFSLVFWASSLSKEFSVSVNNTEEIKLPDVANDIHLATLENNGATSSGRSYNYNFHNSGFNFQMNNAHLSEDGFSIESIPFTIKKSYDTKYHLTRKNSANGRTSEEAGALLQKINYTTQTDGKTLKLARAYELPKGTMWRNQGVELTLYVPEGKFFSLDEFLSGIVYFDDDVINNLPTCENNIHTWKMTKDGIVCASEKETQAL